MIESSGVTYRTADGQPDPGLSDQDGVVLAAAREDIERGYLRRDAKRAVDRDQQRRRAVLDEVA